MKKAKGGAAKSRERKKIKLEQDVRSCSQNISHMFNVISRKNSNLVTQIIPNTN